MGSLVPKSASLDSSEIAREVIERPECFCFERYASLAADHLEKRSRMGQIDFILQLRASV